MAGMVNADVAHDGADAGKAPVAGLVLAAGAGSRFGQPKALVRGADGVPWLVRTIGVLRAAGCAPVIVVLGAEGAAAAALLAEAGPADRADRTTVVVHAADWAEGLSASLRAGLDAALHVAGDPAAAVVVPVDVPDLDAKTVLRVLDAGTDAGEGVTRDSLRQAVFGGRPGHPVLIGRAHWEPLRAVLAGDTGARPYLLAHGVLPVECGDLTTGVDVDLGPS